MAEIFFTKRAAIRNTVCYTLALAAFLLGLSVLKSWFDRPRTLIGTYLLVQPNGCRSDIQESFLVIRGDGTYDQRVTLNDGRRESIESGRWQYDISAQRIEFSRFLVSNETSFDAIVGHPATILVHPQPFAQCWYQQTQVIRG